MHIKLNSSPFVLFKESLLSSLSPQHKKYLMITAIVTMALGLLALCYAKIHSHFKVKAKKSDEDFWKKEEIELKTPSLDPRPKTGEAKKEEIVSSSLDEESDDSFGETPGEKKISEEPFVKGPPTIYGDLDLLQTGKGTIVKANGDIHEGQFKFGMVDGQGKISYKNGEVHEGQFQLDLLHGEGRIDYLNGDYMQGMYKLGRCIKGQGKMTLEYGFCEGEFENGKLHGKGKLSLASFIMPSFGYIYEGQFVNGDLRDGTRTTKDGTIEPVVNFIILNQTIKKKSDATSH